MNRTVLGLVVSIVTTSAYGQNQRVVVPAHFPVVNHSSEWTRIYNAGNAVQIVAIAGENYTSTDQGNDYVTDVNQLNANRAQTTATDRLTRIFKCTSTLSFHGSKEIIRPQSRW